MRKKVYKAKEHKVSKKSFDSDAIDAVERLQKEGHEAYLVGGCVRDLLLGSEPKDFDISTSAEPEEVKAIFRRNCVLIGRRFRLAHLRYGRKILEVATFRAGSPDSEELIERDNEWGSPEEDALRRDFTINGLFYDPVKETIIDYVGGIEDIEKRLLRVIGTPHLRFKQDPVRMIRLLKFRARFGLDVEHDALRALIECRAEIAKSSQARVLEELLRMLESGSSAPFFKLMTEHGFTGLMVPTLSKFFETHEGAHTYNFLKEIDNLHTSATYSGRRPLSRPILAAGLTFPFVQQVIEKQFASGLKKPNLSDLQRTIIQTMNSLFTPFFTLPKRLLIGASAVVTSQYRLTPLEETKRRVRIPNDPEFGMAIKFLELRSFIEPALAPVWKEWREEYEVQKQKIQAKRTRRPARRRTRHS